MVKVLTFNRIDYKLPNLSLIDAMDIAIMRFIYEKFNGEAPLNELNVATVMMVLAPKWQESISIPFIKDMVPNGLLRALSSSIAEKELLSKIQKLEQLGLIRIGRHFLAGDRQSTGDEHKTVFLTDIGRELAQYGGLLLQEGTIDEAMDKLLQLSTPLPIQETYVINPREAYIAIPNEVIEVGENQAIAIKPTSHLALFGIEFLNNIIIGPFNNIPKIVVMGGYIPVVIRRGSQLGYIIHIS